jgi:UDP-sugar transporter A1/2/3
MGRKQSLIQVFSLFLLLISALIMEKVISFDSFLSTNESSCKIFEWDSSHWTKGVAPIMLASFISGLSGALSQNNLQSHGGGRNPYLFSMELCAASVLLLTFSTLFSADGRRIADAGFFHGWNGWTWIPIVTNSIGGIIVGLVTKYAGSVRKGFALIFGIFLSGLSQAILQPEVGVSKEQAIGGLLAATSLWIHATNPHRPKVQKQKKL